jgi:hypothetical protein
MKIKLFLTIGVFALVGCDTDEVKMVKGGTLRSCPNKTVEQMVNGYMSSPSWESGQASDGSSFVNIDGGIAYDGKPVKATVQFLVNDKTFQFQAIEINELPINGLVGLTLLQNMCAE